MKSINRYFSGLYLIVILYLFMFFTIPCFASVDGLVGWDHGSTGYENVMDKAKTKETPCVLFFYRELDRFCQKLGNDYFSKYEVYSFLEDIPKVDIDLGGNEFELELAEKYKVNSFDPTLLVVFPFSELDPIRITPFLDKKDMTPEEFVSTLKNVFSLTYNKIAFSYFEEQEYEKAIKYYEISIKYDSERAYTYFALGTAYHGMAVEEKAPEYLKTAEEHYQKALELDPEFKECKDELEKLHDNMRKMGVSRGDTN